MEKKINLICMYRDGRDYFFWNTDCNRHTCYKNKLISPFIPGLVFSIDALKDKEGDYTKLKGFVEIQGKCKDLYPEIFKEKLNDWILSNDLCSQIERVVKDCKKDNSNLSFENPCFILNEQYNKLPSRGPSRAIFLQKVLYKIMR